MNEFFDENIVIRGLGLKEAGRGRKAAIQSYLQFMAQSNVIEYAESNYAVDIWGGIAVATYDWAMTYEQKGQTLGDDLRTKGPNEDRKGTRHVCLYPEKLRMAGRIQTDPFLIFRSMATPEVNF